MEPLQAFFAERLAAIGGASLSHTLDVVFSCDEAGKLSFSLTGDQVDIAEAVALIGERAEFRALNS